QRRNCGRTGTGASISERALAASSSNGHGDRHFRFGDSGCALAFRGTVSKCLQLRCKSLNCRGLFAARSTADLCPAIVFVAMRLCSGGRPARLYLPSIHRGAASVRTFRSHSARLEGNGYGRCGLLTRTTHRESLRLWHCQLTPISSSFRCPYHPPVLWP